MLLDLLAYRVIRVTQDRLVIPAGQDIQGTPGRLETRETQATLLVRQGIPAILVTLGLREIPVPLVRSLALPVLMERQAQLATRATLGPPPPLLVLRGLRGPLAQPEIPGILEIRGRRLR